jgi:Rho family protein
MPEIRRFAPGAQVLLVGCKADLRHASPPTYCVPVSEAEAMAATIGACSYVECSMNDWDGIDAIFQLAARASTMSTAGNVAKDCIIT